MAETFPGVTSISLLEREQLNYWRYRDLRQGPCRQSTDRTKWILHRRISSVHLWSPRLPVPYDYDPCTMTVKAHCSQVVDVILYMAGAE